MPQARYEDQLWRWRTKTTDEDWDWRGANGERAPLPSQRGKSAELEFETKKMGDEIEFGPQKTTAEDCGRVRIPDRETSKAARAHQKSPVKDGGRKE